MGNNAIDGDFTAGELTLGRLRLSLVYFGVESSSILLCKSV